MIGVVMAPPTDEEVLMDFYKKTRPWGFWNPIRDKVVAADPDFVPNQDFKRDVLNILIGIVWQMTLVIMPIYLIIKEWNAFFICLGIFAITTVLLKLWWYDHLED